MALSQDEINSALAAPQGLPPDELQNAISTMPQQSPSLPQTAWDNTKGFLAHSAGDLGTLGGEILNVPNQTSTWLNQHLSPNTPIIPPYNPGYNYYQPLGVQPNTADNLAVNVAKYAPYATGAGEAVGLTRMAPAIADAGLTGVKGWLASTAPTVAENVLGNTAYGATNDNNNGNNGAVSGAETGLLAGGLNVGGNALTRGAAYAYGKTALPGLISQGTATLKQGLGDASDYATQLINKFKGAQDANTSAWNTVSDNASNLDSQLAANNKTFNSDAYTQHVNDFLAKVDQMEPAVARPYQNAVDFAKTELLPNAPQSFTGAVAARQNLNDTLGDFLNKRQLPQADAQTQGLVSGLKNVLKSDVIDGNASSVNPDDLSSFKQSWEDANQAHQNVQAFKQTTNKAGSSTFSPVLNSSQSAASPEAGILSEYMPEKGQTGTNEINNLANLYGDPKTAQDALASYALRGIDNKGDAGKAALNFYQNMSPEQRSAMLANNPAQPYYDTLNKGISFYGGVPKTAPAFSNGIFPWMGYHAMSASPLALTGFAGGLLSGMPWEHALMLGAASGAAGKIGGNIAQRTTNPGLVNRAMNYSTSPVQTGLISRYVTPAYTAPGGQ